MMSIDAQSCTELYKPLFSFYNSKSRSSTFSLGMCLASHLPHNISSTMQGRPVDTGQPIASHILRVSDVTWPQTVKVMKSKSLRVNILTTTGDRGLIQIDQLSHSLTHLAYYCRITAGEAGPNWQYQTAELTVSSRNDVSWLQKVEGQSLWTPMQAGVLLQIDHL